MLCTVSPPERFLVPYLVNKDGGERVVEVSVKKCVWGKNCLTPDVFFFPKSQTINVPLLRRERNENNMEIIPRVHVD